MVDSLTPVLEPEVGDDKRFLEQVRDFVDKDDFVYMTGLDTEVLVDKQGIPIFDISPAEYGMVSNVQFVNSRTYLKKGAGTIKRLLSIIDDTQIKEANNGKERKS